MDLRKPAGLLLLSNAMLLFGLPPNPPQLAVTEYSAPFTPGGIVSGQDGALWFISQVNPVTASIARITTSGNVTRFPLPSVPPNPPSSGNPILQSVNGIAAGPDGALWFTADFAGFSVSVIGRITTTGAITEFQIPGTLSIGGARSITVGPDGAIWFTSTNIFSQIDSIRRISLSGSFTASYPLPTPDSLPNNLVSGPDGALWFTEGGFNKIGRITTSGALTEYPLPSETTLPYLNQGLTVGPDGALWFLESSINKVARMTTSGALTEYPIPGPTPGLSSEGMTVGPDGALWFTLGNDTVGRATLDGTITGFALPSPITFPTDQLGITTGPDGNLWITLGNASKIGKFAPAVSPPLPAAAVPSTFTLALIGIASIAFLTLRRRKTTATKTC